MAMPDDAGRASRLTILHAPAEPARPERRHFGLFGAFLLGVVVPFLLAAFYLLAVAVDHNNSSVEQFQDMKGGPEKKASFLSSNNNDYQDKPSY